MSTSKDQLLLWGEPNLSRNLRHRHLLQPDDKLSSYELEIQGVHNDQTEPHQSNLFRRPGKFRTAMRSIDKIYAEIFGKSSAKNWDNPDDE